MEPDFRIAVVDDEEILLDTVADWLVRAGAGITVVATARTVAELLQAPPPDTRIVLMDLLLRDGHSTADNIHRLTDAGFTVVACSSRDNPRLIRQAVQAGAHSYVRKTKYPEDLRMAVAAAMTGEPYTSRVHAGAIESARGPDAAPLSPQEREALRLYASGMTIPQVAARMGIEPSTAKGYIDRVRRKYEELGRPAHSKIELRQRAEQDGYLQESDQA